ncbi:XdhC family protein [Agromyces sp. SYSU T00194]|uniref:XdhC family protein n=1 Tax=Agromyces chitinivorans TaxID=3158560 RepID=UPI0033995C88
MLELAQDVVARLGRGESFALATVTAITGSAPLPVGTSMLVDAHGRVAGSVSGGCVEGAVFELCGLALEDGVARTERFGIDDETAFAVGLSCGGELDVFVQPFPGRHSGADAAAGPFHAALAGSDAGVAVVVAGPPPLIGRVLPAGVPAAAITDADLVAAGIRSLRAERLRAEVDRTVATGRTGPVEVECDEAVLRLFVESRLAPPRLLVYGAVAFGDALAAAARPLGYRVTVCDPRPVFAAPERFPHADEVVVARPVEHLAATATDPRTVVCVLGHDARTDVPVLAAALRLPIAFVGALGSRRTHDERLRLLREAGVDDAALARLHSPIGLDLGAATPAETAVSILAEVVAARTGASGLPLRDVRGPIHCTTREGDDAPAPTPSTVVHAGRPAH